MNLHTVIRVLWPAFLVAGLAEGLLFTLIDPEDLIFFGHPVEASHEGVYTVTFFVLWALCALSSGLSVYITSTSFSEMDD